MNFAEVNALQEEANQSQALKATMCDFRGRDITGEQVGEYL